MDTFWIIVGTVIAIVIVTTIVQAASAKENEKMLGEKLQKLGVELAADFRFIHLDEMYKLQNISVAISKDRELLFITGLGQYTDHKLDVSKLTEVELRAQETSITKAARGSQIIGVAVGGALLGGVGAVIGGLSGKQIAASEVKSLKLHLKFDDFENPSNSVLVWSKGIGATQPPLPMEHNRRIAQELIEKLDVLINDGAKKQVEPPAVSKASTANELEKLHQLFEKGVIDELEFKNLKAKVLG